MPKDLFKNVSEGARNLGEGLSEGAKTIGKKSGELVRVAKLKVEMSKLEREMDNNMAALGRFVYLQFRDEEVSQEEIERLLASSKVLEDDIASLEQEIGNMLPKQAVCPNCQTELPASAKFCPNCGGKVTGNNPEE